MWLFKKKNKLPIAISDCETELRWTRIVSHYDDTKKEYVYLTEPKLQFRRGYNKPWQDVREHNEWATPVKKAA